ncbi:MAG: papain-like cysteine protease family protein [Clostridium sp.]|nr:papain-like cysteine protease family protein [Clostridium sp.]
MKKGRRILALFLFALFLSVVSFVQPVKAQTLSNSCNKVNLLTTQVPSDVTNFTLKHFKEELSVIEKNSDKYGFNSNEVPNFKLGEAFNIYFYEKNKLVTSNYYCYPVLYNNVVKGIFSISKNLDGKYTGALSRSFADKLQQLSTNNNYSFRIVSINGDLFAINSNKAILIHKNEDKVLKSSGIITSSEINAINKGITNNNTRESSVYANSENSISQSYELSEDDVTDSNSLNVPIVLQGQHPWCWAATCASIINYLKGTSLKATNVVKYIYGSVVDEGGSEAQICKSYSHWGVSSKVQNGTLSYSTFKNYIDNKEPVNGIFQYEDDNGEVEGHSMSMIGYETLDTGDEYYEIIDPNEDYYIALTATDSGDDVAYYLNGDPFTWVDSIVAH